MLLQIPARVDITLIKQGLQALKGFKEMKTNETKRGTEMNEATGMEIKNKGGEKTLLKRKYLKLNEEDVSLLYDYAEAHTFESMNNKETQLAYGKILRKMDRFLGIEREADYYLGE